LGFISNSDHGIDAGLMAVMLIKFFYGSFDGIFLDDPGLRVCIVIGSFLIQIKPSFLDLALMLYKAPPALYLGVHMARCVFCEIARGSESSWKVYEDQEIMVFLDRYPISYGHILVAPKQHYEDVVRTPPHLVSRAFVVARAFGMASMRYIGATGFRIVTNTGSSAGQIIFHFHVHVIPRYSHGDSGPIEPRAEISDDIAERVVDLYRKAAQDPEVVGMIRGER